MSPRVEPLRRRLDDGSFERLYRRHLPEVYRYVLRDVGNRADAEEVTQNAFLDAYRALGRGHTPEKPRAWLFGIAKNATRRRYRTLSRRPHEVELENELAESVAAEERPQLEELRDAVRSLPATHQQALFLREIEGLSYVEIANRMDLSHAAVETLLFRARRSLRGRLEVAGIRPAAQPVASRRRRLAGLAFLPAGLLRQLDRVALEAERSGLVLKTAAATAAVILGVGVTVAVVPLGAASEREQAVTMPKTTTMSAADTTLFTSVFSANPSQDAAGGGSTDLVQVFWQWVGRERWREGRRLGTSGGHRRCDQLGWRLSAGGRRRERSSGLDSARFDTCDLDSGRLGTCDLGSVRDDASALDHARHGCPPRSRPP